jgi:pilus assembly protein FimV
VRKQSMKTWLSAGALLVMPFAANAAGLGKLTVTSALGQPLRGEIELVAVQKEDVSLVSVRVAPLDAFREAKIEHPIALSSMRFSIEKRPNGDPYVKVTSTTPINEPFLDVLIELNWPAGRLMREYTVLLDPPGFTEPQAVAPVAMPVAPTPLPATPTVSAAEKAAERAAPAPAAPAKKAVEKESEKPAQGEKRTFATQPNAETYGPVKKGETLAKIASQMKPDGVSLEQMLVGLYRGNPEAFTGNMNRMKTGQILRVPEAEKLADIASKDAAREIKVQAADWHAYKQKLATAVAETAPEKTATPPQAAVGKITPKVDDKAAKPAPSADVLKLSKADVKEAKGMQEKIRALEEESTARGKTIKEANERISQLEKNIKEMQRLVELKNQNLAELQKQAAKPAMPAPIVPAKPAAAEAKPAPTPTVKPAEQKPAPKLEAPAKPKPKIDKPRPVVKPAEPASEPAWYEGILANPLYLGGAAAAAVLGGVLWLMMLGNRRRKNLTTFEDSIMTGGDLKANTIYGEASGGVIDTGDTSFLTDFSQAGLGNIDTNDVDPIAEAEVYMAYGRDAQAEEILKEAMTKDPERHEIQLKLLEIYASRKNTNAFEAMASELYAAIGGQRNPVWDKAAEMGRQLDPNNPLYSAAAAGATPKPLAEMGAAAAMEVPHLAGVADIEGITEDVSPDLEFGLEEKAVSAVADVEEPVMEAADDEGALDFDLDLGSMEPLETAEEAVELEPVHMAEDELDMGGESYDAQTIIPQVIEKQASQSIDMAPLDEYQEPSFDLPEAGFDQAAEVPEFVTDSGLAQASEQAALDAEQIQLEAPPEFEVFEETLQDTIQAKPQESPLDFDFQLDEGVEAPGPTAVPAAPAMSGLSQDMAGIDLDLGEPGSALARAQADAEETGTDNLWQEVSTKLDLAKAYVEMGDKEGAREILQEVLQEGDEKQQGDAKVLLAGI